MKSQVGVKALIGDDALEYFLKPTKELLDGSGVYWDILMAA